MTLQNYKIWKLFPNNFENLVKLTNFVAAIRIFALLNFVDNPQLEIFSMVHLDTIDMKILQILQNNSQKTTKEIAAEVNLSTTPVYERIKRMERDGVIRGYVAVLNPDMLNLGFTVFCNIKLVTHSNAAAHDFMNLVRDIPEVLECYNMAGAYDYLLKIYAPNMNYYRDFVMEVLGNIKSIGSVTSTFVMAEVKHTSTLPLNL